MEAKIKINPVGRDYELVVSDHSTGGDSDSETRVEYPTGSCLGASFELFFPERGKTFDTIAAKAVCHFCDVRVECLDSVIINNEKHGVYGGLAERQRRSLRKLLKDNLENPDKMKLFDAEEARMLNHDRPAVVKQMAASKYAS